MIDRNALRTFLAVNNVTDESSDAEIREVLERAAWHPHDIEVAILHVRGKEHDADLVAVTERKTTLYAPNTRLSSAELSELLGVDVIVDPNLIRDPETRQLVVRQKLHGPRLWLLVGLCTLIGVLLVGWASVAAFGIGPYHEPTEWVID